MLVAIMALGGGGVGIAAFVLVLLLQGRVKKLEGESPAKKAKKK